MIRFGNRKQNGNKERGRIRKQTAYALIDYDEGGNFIQIEAVFTTHSAAQAVCDHLLSLPEYDPEWGGYCVEKIEIYRTKEDYLKRLEKEMKDVEEGRCN